MLSYHRGTLRATGLVFGGKVRYTPTEVEALKARIEKLEQMVGKLTLENEALKAGKKKLNNIF